MINTRKNKLKLNAAVKTELLLLLLLLLPPPPHNHHAYTAPAMVQLKLQPYKKRAYHRVATTLITTSTNPLRYEPVRARAAKNEFWRGQSEEKGDV